MEAVFQLVVRPLRGEERIVDLGPDTVTIGRSDANTLPVDDTMASRFHARIELEDGVYHVIDRGSKNGTLVQGVPVKRHALQPGEEILIGDTRIAFRRIGAAAPSPAPVPEPTVGAARPALDFTALVEREPGVEPPSPGSVAALARFAAILAYAVDAGVHVLESAADELFDIVECERATIMVLDPDTGEPLTRFTRSLVVSDAAERDQQVVQAAKAIERPICLRVPRPGDMLAASFGVKNHLLLHPVRSGNRRVGLVALERDPDHDPFDDDDLNWMSIVCAHLSTFLALYTRADSLP